MKSFGLKSWMLPQPVLIIGTFNKNGKPNAMNASHHLRPGSSRLYRLGIGEMLFQTANN